MAQWIEPVFDRTEQDVKQVLNGIDNDKGAFLHTVANRIEGNTEYISDLLNFYNYFVEVDIKQWTREDIPNINDINRMKENLNKLKQAYYILSNTPNLDMNKNTINYKDVNNMEKILFDIDYLIKSMQQNFAKSGVAKSGQNRNWQQRFRTKRTWEAIPFETFNQVLDIFTLANISTQSDTIDDINSVYGTILKTNNKYNELDNLIGGINE